MSKHQQFAERCEDVILFENEWKPNSMCHAYLKGKDAAINNQPFNPPYGRGVYHDQYFAGYFEDGGEFPY